MQPSSGGFFQWVPRVFTAIRKKIGITKAAASVEKNCIEKKKTT
jgi:hypothetical protein